MRLTEEQHQLVEAAGGQPLDVVDPQSNRTYVLLPAELFQRLRPILQEAGVPRNPLPAEAVPGEPLRIKLRELPMPPALAERARRHAKELGLWPRRRYVQEIEDEARLSHYFGGQAVVTLPSKEGPIIVAAGREDSEAFGRQVDALSPEERRQKCTWYPPVWDDSVSERRTPFFSYDD
jgi:hypothetical protein